MLYPGAKTEDAHILSYRLGFLFLWTIVSFKPVGHTKIFLKINDDVFGLYRDYKANFNFVKQLDVEARGVFLFTKINFLLW